MTPIILLDALEAFIKENTKDIIMPVRVKNKPIGGVKERAAGVYKMRLPDKDAETQQIPYILLQFVTGKDDQPEGERPESESRVRIVIAAYSEDAGEGAYYVLNLITRIRTALLKAGVVGDQFLLCPPLEYLVYPDSTAPYFMGEMMSVWKTPTIESEVNILWH